MITSLLEVSVIIRTGESNEVLNMRTLSGFISLKTIIILRRYIKPSATYNNIIIEVIKVLFEIKTPHRVWIEDLHVYFYLK